MTLYLSNRDGNGKTSEEGHYKFQTAVWAGSVLGANALKVTENSPTGMSVLVLTGQFKIDTSSDYAYTGWNNSNLQVNISTADPANPRISTIVAYVDKGASTSPTPPNNPGIVKIISVNGTAAAVPVAPNDTTIQGAVGAGNPYIKLADVRANAAATQILNANITDLRAQVTLGAGLVSSTSLADNSVLTAKINDLAVTSSKIANDAVITSKIPDSAVTSSKLSLDYQAVSASSTTATSTTYVNTSMFLTLPTAGTWIVFAQPRLLASAAGNYAVARLINSSTGSVITNSERIYYNTGTNGRVNLNIAMPVTTTATNQVVRMQFRSGGAYTTTLETDTNGISYMWAVRVG